MAKPDLDEGGWRRQRRGPSKALEVEGASRVEIREVQNSRGELRQCRRWSRSKEAEDSGDEKVGGMTAGC
ncbi:hypothetical protein E2562_022780 [Oryza meyeriana var. granulata]|uniref:Uncharacterized protein n=1 Tax=Oryza meyeriana var. granulata TaxID=110450 RepID=A0A6G1FB04_9ORYZ|nr:hypothetical protein E2562_022780 [Oryza meyeriana var. granulata]